MYIAGEDNVDQGKFGSSQHIQVPSSGRRRKGSAPERMSRLSNDMALEPSSSRGSTSRSLNEGEEGGRET